MITTIAIGTAGALLGFFLGVRSKAVAKKRALERERRGVDNLATIVHRNAPPPPPPARVIREDANILPPPPRATKKEPNYNHMGPSTFSSYAKGTFAKTSICHSCNTVGYYADMWSHEPCPKCGGNVKNHGACKWGKLNGKWQWIKSTA